VDIIEAHYGDKEGQAEAVLVRRAEAFDLRADARTERIGCAGCSALRDELRKT
jgi:Asp/Glu/hydantoin racemase